MKSERYAKAEQLGIEMESDRIRPSARAEMNAFQRPGSRPHQETRLMLTDQMTVDDAEGEKRWLCMAVSDLAEVRR
jgi:hypothetical protein